MATTAWTDHALRRLEEAGYRRGGARRAVVEHLGRQACAVSAREVETALRRSGRAVGRASVYRLLGKPAAKTGGGAPMPIRAEMRWFYPIDWPQISRRVRFDRGRGVCEGCRRPHGQSVRCLPDGRWFDNAQLLAR